MAHTENYISDVYLIHTTTLYFITFESLMCWDEVNVYC